MKSNQMFHAALIALLTSSVGCTSVVGGDDADSLDRSALALTCTTRVLSVVQQGNENRFGLDGSAVALNPAIPVNQVCNQVRNDVRNRGLDAECNTRCADAEKVVAASPVRGFQGVDAAKLQAMRELVDDLNGILGNGSLSGDADAVADEEEEVDGANEADGADEVADAPAACTSRRVLQVVVKGKEQRFGFDDRQVALNPAIPMQNICGDFGRDEACRAACDAARQRAVETGIKGISGDLDRDNLQRMGQLADDFNRANGHDTDFASSAIFQ